MTTGKIDGQPVPEQVTLEWNKPDDLEYTSLSEDDHTTEDEPIINAVQRYFTDVCVNIHILIELRKKIKKC